MGRSGILDPGFWEEGDSFMPDRGFTIVDDLKDLNAELNIPAFMSGRDQVTKAEVKENQSVASVYINVECATQRN